MSDVTPDTDTGSHSNKVRQVEAIAHGTVIDHIPPAATLAVAQLITEGLNTIGYEYCPADMMGSNPKWCKSLSGFKKMTSKWSNI